jgi:hypothetical protein
MKSPLIPLATSTIRTCGYTAEEFWKEREAFIGSMELHADGRVKINGTLKAVLKGAVGANLVAGARFVRA